MLRLTAARVAQFVKPSALSRSSMLCVGPPTGWKFSSTGWTFSSGFSFKTSLLFREVTSKATPVALPLVQPGFQRSVGVWLAGTSLFIISMIALGGYTRLSGSGLSMTNWSFVGRKFPRTDADWMKEFDEYKTYPEYKQLHPDMELDEFQHIYFVEWLHRMWGRTAGLIFTLPLGYFLYKGALSGRLGLRLGGLLGLGVTQAFLGWYMVQSGFDKPELHTPLAAVNQQPRVSPYRLLLHFSAALTLYVGCLWSAMDLLRPTPAQFHPSNTAVAAARQLRRFAVPATALVGITLMSGVFVAGNDAGYSHNTWPKMLDDWVPPEWIATVNSPVQRVRCFFEDTAVVQFNHRSLAYMTALTAVGVWMLAEKLPVSLSVVYIARALPIVAISQTTVGIVTLLSIVPPELGVLHQSIGVGTFTAFIFLLHALRIPLVL